MKIKCTLKKEKKKKVISKLSATIWFQGRKMYVGSKPIMVAEEQYTFRE